MKCAICQRLLLGLQDSQRLPAELEAHLAACQACQAWQRRLIQIAVNVPRLPVPASSGKAKLLKQILQQPRPAPLPVPRARSSAWPWLVGGAAAAVVLVVCGLWIGNLLGPTAADLPKRPHVEGPAKTNRQPAPKRPRQPGEKPRTPIEVPESPSPESLVARLIRCDLRLARADSPRERVEAVLELADSLERESHILARAAGSKPLAQVARLYRKVVREAVIPRSRALPDGERPRVLPGIVARLLRTERNAEQLARQMPPAAAMLRTIAAAAHEGQVQLGDLLKKEAG